MARTPTPAQLAARERFAEMARSGAFKKKAAAARNPAKKTVSQKISQLTREGYPQKQAVAIALNEQRQGKVKRNPSDLNVAQTILAQLGGNRFIAMTGAKEFIAGSQFLGFKIARNMSQANVVTITYAPSRDLYTMSFIKTARGGLDSKEIARFEDIYADQLRSIFTQVTGMETSLGTMGRRNNPRKPTYRRTPYVAPDPDLAFTRAYDLLNNLDFEDVYYRERRISAAKGVRLNAALDRILDAMERLAKNMKP